MRRRLRNELLAEHRDRALSRLVDVDERAALRLGEVHGVYLDVHALQSAPCLAPELVVAECGVERRGAVQPRQLDGRDRAAARRLLPELGRVEDLARRRHARHARELHPLDVTHDRQAHTGNLTDLRARPLRR